MIGLQDSSFVSRWDEQKIQYGGRHAGNFFAFQKIFCVHCIAKLSAAATSKGRV
jgi:hypothetical protein